MEVGKLPGNVGHHLVVVSDGVGQVCTLAGAGCDVLMHNLPDKLSNLRVGLPGALEVGYEGVQLVDSICRGGGSDRPVVGHATVVWWVV